MISLGRVHLRATGTASLYAGLIRVRVVIPLGVVVAYVLVYLALDPVIGTAAGIFSALPVIAAGGLVDGRSMAAAFALGAEGVQMGTRMVSAAESPVHENFKHAICEAAETDTVFLNRHHRPGLRALRTERSSRLEEQTEVSLAELQSVLELYFGGDMEASIALSGQVVGRIDRVKPVSQIIGETMEEFRSVIASLSRYEGGE